MEYKKYADEKHQQQSEEFIMELGKFVFAFERVCNVMRFLIMFMLRSQGLKNEGMEQVIVGDKASAELQILIGAIYCELPNQDELDKKCVKDVLKKFKEITEKRNVLLHSSWDVGTKAADQELFAYTVRFRAKQNQGSGTEVRSFSASEIRTLSEQLKCVQVSLQRLQYCVTQSGLKVEDELSKPM